MEGPDAASSLAGPDRAAGVEFDGVLAHLERNQQLRANADELAIKAVTGQLHDPTQYTIAATESSLHTQMTVALRNKAVEAYQEIMRMQL